MIAPHRPRESWLKKSQVSGGPGGLPEKHTIGDDAEGPTNAMQRCWPRAFPPRALGKILLPYPRLFFIALPL
jgi:hypothetical protein